MSKSLKARCIRRWKVQVRGWCDSKVSPYWRRRHLRSFFRSIALTTADSMVERVAENNAKVDFEGCNNGWSPEFSAWYRDHREHYRKGALELLNNEATSDEIDEEIFNELEAWND
ncbi:hypothetical protein DOX53_18330 [Cronobacter malonaticus]|uniref:hypothetical protein n=1 Tax=Cronobacter TaxID=413496 RepID=UPI000DA24530|nr:MULTISPECIES: hypothetical protein [Cronobacter]EGT4313719.1 hypothetical protein [Cronobacter malonaticus]EGT4335000.1 hypothetical protein [Cronobacter malonaticus]EGT4489661.1 hypothetical protein [Cronobacter malonaticus]EKM1390367.1 hypothetical protein [Cronobacter sakazakii]EKM6441233.1 hypothetical protein [Cronobacter sakazakii]